MQKAHFQTLTKAWDATALVAELKAQCLPAELEIIKQSLDSIIIPWATQSLALAAVSTPWMSMLTPAVAMGGQYVDQALGTLLAQYPPAPAPAPAAPAQPLPAG